MRRPGAVGMALAAAAAGALGASGTADALRHRRPLPPLPPPRSLAVDEGDAPYRLVPTRRLVGAGDVRIRIYNRGMDDHDLTLVDADGVLRSIPVPAGGQGELDVRLASGTVTIYCSLFQHRRHGMSATLLVARS